MLSHGQMGPDFTKVPAADPVKVVILDLLHRGPLEIFSQNMKISHKNRAEKHQTSRYSSVSAWLRELFRSRSRQHSITNSLRSAFRWIWQDFGVVWSIDQVTIEKVGLKHWSIENLSRLKTKSRIHQKVKISENLWQIDLFWDTSNIFKWSPCRKNTDPSEIAMRSSLTNRAPKLDLVHSTTGPIWFGSMSIGWDFHVLTMERLTWFLDAYTAFHSRFGYIYIYIHNDI